MANSRCSQFERYQYGSSGNSDVSGHLVPTSTHNSSIFSQNPHLANPQPNLEHFNTQRTVRFEHDHHLSVPQPQHSPAPTNLHHLILSQSSSNPMSSAASHETTNQPRNLTKRTASQHSSQTKNCEQESGAGTKSTKAILDEFLSPCFRLPNNLTLPNQHTLLELYKMEAAQLGILADKYSRRCGHAGIPEIKKKALRDFNASTEKLLSILCIHLGISQDVAAAEVGKCVSHRSLRSYDYFKKSKEVSDIYRENGGATNPRATELVSELWASLSKAEKDVFVYKVEEGCAGMVENVDDNESVNMEEIRDHRPINHGLVTFVRGENDEVTRKKGFQTSSGNLELSKNKCRDFVSEFIKENNMSRVHPVQFSIFAVSTHLAKHCFQYMVTTPGLWEWANYDLTSTKSEHTTSKMQAFVTGRAIAGLVRPKRAKGSTVELDKLKATLNQVIRKATENPNETWTWSNCEARLEDKGFKLKYEPFDHAYRCWITSPNSAVTEEKARRINIDIVSNPVSLIPIEGFVDKYIPGRNKKRKRNDIFQEEEESREENEHLSV